MARSVKVLALTSRRTAIAALVATTSSSAWSSDPVPYYIGASQGITHDSNVLRVPGGTGDNYSSTGISGGYDQMISRQHVFAAAHVDLNRFQKQKQLGNTSYGMNAGWDWATIEKLTGSFSLGLNQNLATQNDNILQPSPERNISRNEQFGARANWGENGALALQSGYGHSSLRYSAPSSRSLAYSQDSVDLGLRYRLGASLTVIGALRYSRAVADQALVLANNTFLANTTNGRNVDLSALWQPTIQTRLNSRVSWTHQTNSGVSDRNYSGLTGSLDFSYAPTAKLLLTGSLNRDAGMNGTSISATDSRTNLPIAGRSENSQIANNLALSAVYALTSKVNLNAGVGYRYSTIVNALNVGSNSSSGKYADTSRNASFGANYDVARHWSMACNLAHLQRDVGGTLPFQYSANTVNCSAQYLLR